MAKIDNFTFEELKEIFENSTSYREMAQKLGYANYGGDILKKIKQVINDNNFCTKSLKTKTKEQKENMKQDFIGKQFGRLTVLSIDEEKTRETKRSYFVCQCSCNQHKIVSVRMDALTNKKSPTRSCGCLSKEQAQEQGIKNREDLIGYVSGQLTVIGYNQQESEKHNRPYWNVQCQCGRKYAISSVAIKRGQSSCGCEKSKGELKIIQLLQSLNINFIRQHTFKDLYGNLYRLSFDFYLPEKNILIEYQGEQHYMPVEFFGGEEQLKLQQTYDNLKREYCKSHNIKLIEVPYWDYDKLDENYLKALLE